MSYSIFPYVCWWKFVDLFNLVSIFSKSVVQKKLKILVSLFDIPKCTQTISNKKPVASCILMVFVQAIGMHILLNLSTFTNKYSCPFMVFGIHTKSMEIFSHGLLSMGKGWYTHCFLLIGFPIQLSIHPLINRSTYSCILGQYTYCCKLAAIFPTPKFQATLEVWSSLIS